MTLLSIIIEILLVTGSYASSFTEAMVPIVVFQADGIPSTETLLVFKKTFHRLQKATFCFRFYVRQSRELNPILSYAIQSEDDELSIVFDYVDDKFTLVCCNDAVDVDIPMKIHLREWVSVCLAIDLESSIWTLVTNGTLNKGRIPEVDGTENISEGGILVIGQEQDSFGSGFNERDSFSGKVADLVIYSGILSEEVMIHYSLCRNFSTSQRPIVEFSKITQDFDVKGVAIETMPLSSICHRQGHVNLIFPERRTFEDGKLLCRKVGGELTVPSNEEENMALYQKSLYVQEVCGVGDAETLWLGIIGDTKKQRWVNDLTKDPLTYYGRNFDKAANITEPETCVIFRGSNETLEEDFGAWVPAECDLLYCPVCQFKGETLLRMRGLCQESNLDREYFVNLEQSSPTFTGVLFSEMTKVPPTSEDDDGYGEWRLVRLDNPDIRAVLHMESPTHYPLGLNKWHVEHDECGESEEMLMMTSCDVGEFSCRDGTCITIEQRCDKEFDCPDGTDEVDCEIVFFTKNYDSHSSPPRSHRTKPVQVKFFLTILSMRRVDLLDFGFTCEAEVRLQWIDERLIFHHLKFGEMLNAIDDDDEERMPWIPELEFLGDGETTATVVERRRSLRVSRFSPQPLPDNDENIFEDEVFDAASNPLVLIRKLTLTTSCQFDLEAFPFDTQTCKIRVLLSGITKEYVVLDQDGTGVKFEGRRKLLEYYLSSETIMKQDEGNYSGLAIEVTLSNLGYFYVTSTFVPTFIIVVVGYTVFFFPLWNFNERVMVGLTCVLVEAAFFSQMNESIPHTAYLKLVDIWFVFCIIMLFMDVVALVVIHYLKEASAMSAMGKSSCTSLQQKGLQAQCYERASRVNFFFRVFFPFVSVLFIISFYIASISI